jgi:pyruvate/2-oxoglutarate dehydrogenase complex dihydrolipoamide acyltransferase (E2) component
MSRLPLVVPELGLGDRLLAVSLWLVAPGREVQAGDRLVELLADGVTIDLPAPAAGRLERPLAAEDDPVSVGQTLAWIEMIEPADDA